MQEKLNNASQKFQELIGSELKRIERMKTHKSQKPLSQDGHKTIGVMPGDGIGPLITKQALRVLGALIPEEIKSDKVQVKIIEGMTIERRAELMQSLPDDVLAACKACDALVKGPFVTPRAGDEWPNLTSANSLLRRGLDLFAAVRPITMPDKGIDWTFFRENIEGEYIWGDKGIQVDDDLAIDFKVQTRQGTERIARAAFEFCRKNGKNNLTIVTKANIVKLVDGNFIKVVREVGKEYPEVNIEERLVDAMAAKMMDKEFSQGLQVFVMPNLYGDIITDIAAEHQGGLGTACSANIGDEYALFEAIHGTAPYLIAHNRAQYADPCSLIRAVGMMLAHIGYADRSAKLDKALDICTRTEKAIRITTDKDGATIKEFTDYLIETIGKLA